MDRLSQTSFRQLDKTCYESALEGAVRMTQMYFALQTKTAKLKLENSTQNKIFSLSRIRSTVLRRANDIKLFTAVIHGGAK